MTAPDQAVAVEHWYRHRTTVESIFRDSKHGAALRHLLSGYPRVNMAWMRGALLAACMAAWLHQLTAATAGELILAGHGVRGGKAMIATLRHRLIAVPGRLIRHAGQLTLRLPPGCHLLAEVLARLRALPRRPDHRPPAPTSNLEPAHPERHPGVTAARPPGMATPNACADHEDQLRTLLADSGQRKNQGASRTG